MRAKKKTTHLRRTARKMAARVSQQDSDAEWFPHFDVSAGLKKIIGQDLITDDLIAVFELVKNAFDAHATRVDIVFDDDSISVCDNGKGMTLEDIKSKWLFVAYSAKRDGTEDANYRHRISSRQHFAGNKGIGRFSCDRLGEDLSLQTKTATATQVEVIDIHWSDFEHDDKQRFESIRLNHRQLPNFELPKGLPRRNHGTVLTIHAPRDEWSRAKILRLRTALAKLINPLDDLGDDFSIYIRAPREDGDDARLSRDRTTEESARLKVNGRIENFAFGTLKDRTTFLHVSISAAMIVSRLEDRGVLIYETREPCPYTTLLDSGYSCSLFYLNRAAKTTFTRRVGVQPVNFGSIFLFRNGFRVYPYGEPGDDTFEIDKRKQQGYARFLGTRDIIGRIDISGDSLAFQESSSRDKGLLVNDAYKELVECFHKHCLKRLERYVVGVTWELPGDKDSEDAQRLETDAASVHIATLIAKLTDVDGIEIVKYNKNLVRVLSERADNFDASATALEQLAERQHDKRLKAEIAKARDRFKRLQRAEAAARESARREHDLRLTAEKSAAQTATSLAEERKKSLFLSSLGSLDMDTILNLHHQIVIYGADIQHLVSNRIEELASGENVSTKDMMSTLESVLFKIQKVLAASRFATKANFRLDAEEIKADIVAYVREYIEQVCPLHAGDGIAIAVDGDATLTMHFRPIEVSMLVDNLVSNARKAKARSIRFSALQVSKDKVQFSVTDDGRGLEKSIEDPESVFDKGVTTTSGSGLGLYFVRQIVERIGGDISASISETRRITFWLTFIRDRKAHQ